MRISSRDRAALGLCAAAVTGLCFWLWVFEPVQSHLEMLDRKVQARQADYRELQVLAQRYRSLSASAQQTEERLRRARGFSILSYLEKLAVELGVRKKIPQMRAKGGQTTTHYRENAIEVKMAGVRLPDLVRFLYFIEHPKQEESVPDVLRIRELRVRSNPESKEFLDVTFQVSGYELLEDG